MTAKQKRIWRDWQRAKKQLPQDPSTPEIEQRIVRVIRKLRAAEKRVFKVRVSAGNLEMIRHYAGLWKCTPEEAAALMVSESLQIWKARNRPRRTREDLEREAREIFPRARSKVNFTAAIKQLK